MEELFHEFEKSLDTLRIYDGQRQVFSSRLDRLAPMLEYLALGQRPVGVTVFDRIAGNAAALLAVKAGARSMWSPLGSRAAALTLAGSGVECHFSVLVDSILKPGSQEMCPMERLSLGKDPESFYGLIVLRQATGEGNFGG